VPDVVDVTVDRCQRDAELVGSNPREFWNVTRNRTLAERRIFCMHLPQPTLNWRFKPIDRAKVRHRPPLLSAACKLQASGGSGAAPVSSALPRVLLPQGRSSAL